jgi:cell division protein FtsQ
MNSRSFAAGSSIGRLRSPVTFALPRRATARRLCIALASLALLGGGWLWLRDAPLVAVERVQISGVQGVDAAPIEAALQGAARSMSTLNVNVGALRAAVAPFRVVRDLSVSTSFPHGLRIRVVEQPPVAALSVGGVRTAVAADGVVLGPSLLSEQPVPLPAIAAAGSPTPPGGHVEDATVRAELSVLGAAPAVLLGWVSRVFTGSEGLTVAMRNGVSIYFGDASRPHAKWLSAARVLADPSSAGATYVDVRAPERPAAGTTAAGGLEGSAAPAQVSASDPTSAALANVLAEAVSGGSGAASAPGSIAAGSSGAGSAAGEPPSAAPSEAAAGGGAQSESSAGAAGAAGAAGGQEPSATAQEPPAGAIGAAG